MGSGLYDALTTAGLLVKHQEVDEAEDIDVSDYYKILLPDQIAFISYPYEWSFSQLKDAAMATLAAQKLALHNGLVMKDASAYNIQFLNGRPILIDTLSFEPYAGQKVWAAYQQFCQHFLAPLALMASVDMRLNLMLRDYIDGLPLDLAVKLLPRRRRLNGGLLMHLVLHNAANRRKGSKVDSVVRRNSEQASPANKRALLGLVDSLERTINKLKLSSKLQTVWGEYYDDTNYSPEAFAHKKMLVAGYVKHVKAKNVWDLGGNDGTFSRAALDGGAQEAICFDIDPLAVEKSYQVVKKDSHGYILPLRSDLTNPSPAIGWANNERDSLTQRAGEHNTVMALALVHHLAIANNLPFGMIASFFAQLGQHLIIEFILKEDSKVQILLSTRPDIFSNYDQGHFETAFNQYYEIIKKDQIKDSQRTLYLMKRRLN
jgi:hypothetical protein